MSGPEAGIEKSSAGSSTRSGVPSFQPSANWGGGGMSLGSPRGAPPRPRPRGWRSPRRERDWSCLSFGPTPGSGFQGGISRSATTEAISAARLRACSYVSRAKGPTWWRRWQSWHFFWRIGATSLVNVGGPSACRLLAPCLGGVVAYDASRDPDTQVTGASRQPLVNRTRASSSRSPGPGWRGAG